MPEDITETSQFTATVQAPSSTDPVDSASFLAQTLQPIVDRTRYLFDNLGALPSLAANRVLGRRSTGVTAGQPATDFAFDTIAESTGVGWIDRLLTQGAAIVSAATTNLAAATGYFVHVTGATDISSFGTAAAGVTRVVRFAQSLTLTHNPAALILPTGQDIETEADDTLVAVSEGGGVWRVIAYQRADGTSLSAIGFVRSYKRTIRWDDVDFDGDYGDDTTATIPFGDILPKGTVVLTVTSELVENFDGSEAALTAEVKNSVTGLNYTPTAIVLDAPQPDGTLTGESTGLPAWGGQIVIELNSSPSIPGTFNQGEVEIVMVFVLPDETVFTAPGDS